MNPLNDWFTAKREEIEESYLAFDDDYLGSGWGSTPERWERARRVILDAVSSGGSFLDVGCANGYLLKSLVEWSKEVGISLEPFGIDLSNKLAARAQERFRDYPHHFSVGNILEWRGDQRFDYVRVEIEYVPQSVTRPWITRLLQEVVAPSGTLIVTSYGSRSRGIEPKMVGEALASMGHEDVSYSQASDADGTVLTRVAWIRNSDNRFQEKCSGR